MNTMQHKARLRRPVGFAFPRLYTGIPLDHTVACIEKLVNKVNCGFYGSFCPIEPNWTVSHCLCFAESFMTGRFAFLPSITASTLTMFYQSTFTVLLFTRMQSNDGYLRLRALSGSAVPGLTALRRTGKREPRSGTRLVSTYFQYVLARLRQRCPERFTNRMPESLRINTRNGSARSLTLCFAIW